MKTRGKVIAFWVAGVLIAGGVVLGGWQAGWWFRTQNTNRESRLYQHQFGRQTALREEISRKLGNITDIDVQVAGNTNAVQVEALKAQRLAFGRIVCQDAEQVNKVTDLPDDQQQFVLVNCKNGDVSATSLLRTDK